MLSRSEILLASFPHGSRLIEVGPSFSPIAPKSAGWDTAVIDHLTQNGLKAKYAGLPGVDVNRIEHVDYIWHEGSLSDAVPPDLHGTFDAFIASHVIEHAPDLISFLDSAAALLKLQGVVALAVPDKRFCFDYFQPSTTTGQVLEAHEEQRSRHSRRVAFDHHAYSVISGGVVSWGQHPVAGLQLCNSLEQAQTLSDDLVREGGYIDLHAWRFSPASFELLLLELARLRKTDWQVQRITEPSGCEFFAWLQRGGIAAAAELSDEAVASRRLALLKRTLLEAQAQIDWLLAGQPELRTTMTLPVMSAPGATSANAEGGQPADKPVFVDWFPARDNVGRAFEGEWSSAVPGLTRTGLTPLFDDPRLLRFEGLLGGFAGKKVLELGPLEGGHTYMMTQRGAIVTAIESNLRAWLRCLAVKDAVNMTGVNLLLGSFIPYLASSPPRVDFALASGVLYHMTDPVGLLLNLCNVSDAVGLWTHYFDADVLKSQAKAGKFDFRPRQLVTPRGRTVELHDQQYLDALKWSGFCGGSAPGSSWLRRQDILGTIEDEGFECQTFLDQPEHPNGPAFCVFARRRR